MLSRLITNDPIRARCLLLAGFAILLLLHWPALGGGFTSDSLGLIRHCATLSEQGQLWAWMLNGFGQSLAVASNYYRPLSSAALCMDYSLYGPTPLGWHLNQLILHATNGYLLYCLARSLAQGERLKHSLAALAALIFWLSPANPEVSIWIAGRYNVLALLFMLLSVLALVHSRPWASALAMALALCSKESAMVLPVLLASISGWRHHIEAGPCPPFSQRVTNALRELWPSALVFLAYLFWRWYLFGDPLSVYPHSQVEPQALLHGWGWVWLERLPSLAHTLLPAWREQPLWRTMFWLTLALALVWSGLRAWRAGRLLALWGLPMLWLLVSVLALLPHLQVLSSAGQGSRLLYGAGAWFALAITLPWSGYSWHQQRPWRLGFALCLLLGLLYRAQAPGQHDWSFALHHTQALTRNLAQQAQQNRHELPAGHWSMVLIPDHLGVALLGRNAQGALVFPPFQAEPLIAQLVPLVPQDLGSWHQRLKQGIHWPAPIQAAQQQAWPSRYYCVDPQDAHLIALDLATPELTTPGPASSAQEWHQAWRHALSSSRCASYGLIASQPQQRPKEG